MRAMVLSQQGSPLELREIPRPQPEPEQLLLRVQACGICRTDLHVVDGDLTEPTLPLVPGHQIVATVAELGADVGRFAIGDVVGVPWLGRTCRRCDHCTSGRENLCDDAAFTGYNLAGGFAEYTVADQQFVFPLPPGYPALQAAPLLCAGLIGYRAYAMATDARRLGLYGFGAAAHILIQLARHQGREVYAFTRPGDDASKSFARDLGAVWAGDSTEAAPVALDAAIIFAPIGSLVPASLRALRKGGQVICAGIHMSECRILEEQGRALLCAPFLASAVMAGYAILQAGSQEQKAALLPGIADGSVLGALAVTEQTGLWREDDVRLEATKSGDGFTLNGTKRYVADGQNADFLVVAGRTSAGLSLFTVDAKADGVGCEALPVMDPTRKLADLTFNNAPAQLLGVEGQAHLDDIYNAVLVSFAHEMVGGAQAMLDAIIDYAKLRVQFGRLIGSFQSIKHRCADLLVEIELAKAATYQAAQLLADGQDATAAASQAKAAASDVYLHAAEECIQFHGGIGFTWENDTHLWFKRAKSSEVFMGTPNDHRERMLQAMGV